MLPFGAELVDQAEKFVAYDEHGAVTQMLFRFPKWVEHLRNYEDQQALQYRMQQMLEKAFAGNKFKRCYMSSYEMFAIFDDMFVVHFKRADDGNRNGG